MSTPKLHLDADQQVRIEQSKFPAHVRTGIEQFIELFQADIFPILIGCRAMLRVAFFAVIQEKI
jgi:hypothetical protein